MRYMSSSSVRILDEGIGASVIGTFRIPFICICLSVGSDGLRHSVFHFSFKGEVGGLLYSRRFQLLIVIVVLLSLITFTHAIGIYNIIHGSYCKQYCFCAMRFGHTMLLFGHGLLWYVLL